MLTVRVTGSELKALIKALAKADYDELGCMLENEAQNTITIDETKDNIRVSIESELERFLE